MNGKHSLSTRSSTSGAASADAASDDARLRSTVADILTGALGKHARVGTIEREPSPFATLFPAEILRVTLADGTATRLFLKYLGEEDEDHPDKQIRDLEIRVYEALLTNENLPVLKYYGSLGNRRTGRTEVFLEYVDDWNLKYHELDHWYRAASRLAHLHRHFGNRTDELAACVPRFDSAYHRQWARRALNSVGNVSPRLAKRLERVVGSYRNTADLLGEQPPTLVHNDLAPKNVIADRSADPARICFVDWEMAGAGCGMLDLVQLKYGLKPEPDRRMREAYLGELQGTGLVPEDPESVQRLVDACQLHQTLVRLWRNQVWCKPLDIVTQWVDEAERLWRRIG